MAKFLEPCASDGGGTARRHRDGKAAPDAVTNEIGNVASPKRVTAREDEQRLAWPERRDPVNQPLAFVRGQLVRVTARDRFGAAVNAGERARPCDLPDDDERRRAERPLLRS